MKFEHDRRGSWLHLVAENAIDRKELRKLFLDANLSPIGGTKEEAASQTSRMSFRLRDQLPNAEAFRKLDEQELT